MDATPRNGPAPPGANSADWADGPVAYSRFPLADLDAPPPIDLALLARRRDAALAATQQDPELAILAPLVDAERYRAVYPDIDRPDIDPVDHFHAAGWREGRDPNAWFDTKYYLQTNPDIVAAGIDPLLHYATYGRAEERSPRRPGGMMRAIVDAAIAPGARPPGYDAPATAATLNETALTALLAAACTSARGLAVSVSHDRSIDITGGVQILIADEQMLFNGDGCAYLHLSPAVARLTLADPASPDPQLQLVLDGRFLGLAAPTAIAAALETLPAQTLPTRIFIVHSLFGHGCEDLLAIHRALRPAHSFFWLHDYASVCEGYNLLRDDSVFCGAPDAGSMQCRICVYGAGRPAYRATLHGFFTAIGFHILAPSQAALRLWLDRAFLPFRSARVHANCAFLPSPPTESAPAPLDRPIRIAFVGYPIAHKGWPLFLDLVRLLLPLGVYRLYHFASADSLQRMDGVTCVAARVDRFDRFAMITALQAHEIDLVLVLSPWPETFSYVTHEAFAAGADVITLAVSGNVADAVRRHRRGVVLRDAPALLRFFADLHAAHYGHQRRRAGIQRGILSVTGTTATVDPDADPAANAAGGEPDPDRLRTEDPQLRVIAAGRVIPATPDGDLLRFVLRAREDAPVGEIHLVSRSLAPGSLRSDIAERRRLGVAIAALRLDGEDVPPGDPRRRAGWHGGQNATEWTGGNATLGAGEARILEIRLAGPMQYVALPMLVEAAPPEAGAA